MSESGSSSPADGRARGALLGALEEGVLRVRDGRVVEANAAMRGLLGRDDLLGRPVHELFTDPAGAALRRLETLEAARVRRPDGGLRPVSIRRASEEIFLVADRSRERQLEEEVARCARPDPLAPLRREAVARVEHELATAHTVVRGYLRLLLEEADGPLAPGPARLAREALRVLERSGELLRNLMALAREAADDLPLEPKPERLHELLERAVRSVEPLLRRARLEVEFERGADEDRVRADSARLEAVFTNLLSNCTRFAPPGSAISIQTSIAQLERPFICVAVRDAGPGIDPELAPRIFEPFVRGASGGGAGLGLAICRRSVEAHGGTIEAVAGEEGGLFRVLLPLDSD